ncbi:MAG: glycogen-binding domain-containing protein [Desulfonauticus sp.]|nr:glycogen-binding domain-containing protein [Desulfonauticus sp.]
MFKIFSLWPPEKKNNELDSNQDQELLILARRLKNLPDREPPSDLADKIIQSLEPKKLSFWKKLYVWLITPKAITISPLKLAPALALSLLLIWLAFGNFFSGSQVFKNTQKLVPVTFVLHYPQAHSVSVIGSFNQWQPKALKMHNKNGTWTLEIKLPQGRYEYAFLIDNKLVIPDPKAEFCKADLFGHKNSIIFVNHENPHNI